LTLDFVYVTIQYKFAFNILTCNVLTDNGLYDVIQYGCLKTASLFFLSNCRISLIPEDGLRIRRNVEQK